MRARSCTEMHTTGCLSQHVNGTQRPLSVLSLSVSVSVSLIHTYPHPLRPPGCPHKDTDPDPCTQAHTHTCRDSSLVLCVNPPSPTLSRWGPTKSPRSQVCLSSPV